MVRWILFSSHITCLLSAGSDWLMSESMTGSDATAPAPNGKEALGDYFYWTEFPQISSLY